MTLSTRRFLYITFILLFVTITPLVSLYASGYKLGGGFKVEKTGILILDTAPREAKIYIDGKPEQKFWRKIFNVDASYIRTPAKIKNLLPGEYFVKMEIDGYWPWQKKLKILPGQSTYAETVTLFKRDVPIIVESGSFISLKKENENFFTLSQEKQTNLFDLGLESISQTWEMDNKLKFNWSNNDKNFIFNNILFSVKNGKTTTDLSSLIGKTKKLSFSSNDNNLIYFQSNKGLNSLDIKNKKISELINNPDISDWQNKNNLIYFIDESSLGSTLMIWDTDNEQTKRQISLPISDYQFVNPDHQLINLLLTYMYKKYPEM